VLNVERTLSHHGCCEGKCGGATSLLIRENLNLIVYWIVYPLEIIRYLFRRRWMGNVGAILLHSYTFTQKTSLQSYSTVFGTGLNYTALRLLAVDKDHPVCIKARAKLHQLGMVLILEFPGEINTIIVRRLHVHSCMGESFGCRSFTGREITLFRLNFGRLPSCLS